MVKWVIVRAGSRAVSGSVGFCFVVLQTIHILRLHDDAFI